MLETDVVSSSPKATEDQHRCFGDDPHRHCGLCPARIEIEGSDNEGGVDPVDGFWCHGEMICAFHRRERMGKELCEACADTFDLDEAAQSVENALRGLYNALTHATNHPWAANPVQLQEIARGIEQYEKQLRAVKDELPAKILFATYGRVA